MRSEKKETALPVPRTLKEYTLITAAVLIMDIGIYVFKFPNNFSFGGVSGMAVVFSKFSSFLTLASPPAPVNTPHLSFRKTSHILETGYVNAFSNRKIPRSFSD